MKEQVRELIRQGLNAAGIASVCGDQDSVFAAKEAQQLLRLLTCLSDLSDLPLLRAVLAGDLFGWTAERIEFENELVFRLTMSH